MRAIALAILILLTACGSKNERLLKQLGMEEIAKKRFDIETFDRNKRKEQGYISNNNDSIYEFTDSTGVYHEQTSTDKFYYEKIIYPDSLVYDAYVFYRNGAIKIFGRSLIKGVVNLGNLVYFDEQGNVTEVINRDEPYKFTLEQVLDYMKKNDIDIWDKNVGLYRGLGSEHDPFPDVYTWLITIRFWDYTEEERRSGKKITIAKFKERSIELDAVTGGVKQDTTVVLESY